MLNVFIFMICHFYPFFVHNLPKHFIFIAGLVFQWNPVLREDISAYTIAISFITARNEVGARLCFYTCLSFCPWGGCLPQCMLECTPWADTPHPWADTPWADPPRQTPPEVHARIRSTSGRCASYWNAILF